MDQTRARVGAGLGPPQGPARLGPARGGRRSAPPLGRDAVAPLVARYSSPAVRFGGTPRAGSPGRRGAARATTGQSRAAESRARIRPPLPPTRAQITVRRAIPRRIVQSWVDRNLTPGIAKLCKSHRNRNPGYEYAFYDDGECREFIRKHFPTDVLRAYDAILPGAFKSDLFRYCELYVHGGWWFDIDMISVGSIDSLIEPTAEFACPRDGGITTEPALYQAVLGAAKASPILRLAIERATLHASLDDAARKIEMGSASSLAFTGPVLLARCAHRVLGSDFRGGRNVMPRVARFAFGTSCKRSGHCAWGGRTLCIGHPDPLESSAQRLLHAVYGELKSRSRTWRPYYLDQETGYCASPSDALPSTNGSHALHANSESRPRARPGVLPAYKT